MQSARIHLSVDRHDHSDKYHFPDGMQGASVIRCEKNYPPSKDGAYLLLKKHLPFRGGRCSVSSYRLLSVWHLLSISEGLNEGENCRRKSWMSATDFSVSFIQLALIQNLPATSLGSTRLCNKKGKHSTSVVPATRVATGLLLMILIKPGPFLSISPKGKRLDTLRISVVYFTLQLGAMWEYWVFFTIAAASVKAALRSEKSEPCLLCCYGSTDICSMTFFRVECITASDSEGIRNL